MSNSFSLFSTGGLLWSYFADKFACKITRPTTHAAVLQAIAFEIHKKQKLFTPLPEWSGSIWWKEKSNKAVRKQIKFRFPNPEV